MCVRKKTHLVKKDKYGTHWVTHSEDITYKNDEELIKKLNEFYKPTETNIIITYILDHNSNYNDVTVTPAKDEKTYYRYYTHKNTSKYITDKSYLVMNKDQFKPAGSAYETPSDNILVYYLKENGTKEGKQPFLIRFTEAKGLKEKIYYSKDKFQINDWEEFKFGKEVLEQRLSDLEKKGICAKDESELRKKAYDILKAELPPKPPAVHPQAPGVHPQPPATEASPPDIKLIAGSTAGAVGGTAVLGAGGYGYYLYATTIKLLT